MSTVCALVAVSSTARAQSNPAVACRKTETQPECHARLKCKASEELEDCQKRLVACTATETLEACEKKAGAKSSTDGNTGAEDRDRDQHQRERDADHERAERREREEPDRERSERRERQEPDRERREREEPDRQRSERRERGESSGRRRERGARGSKSFQANKTFGLGLELGEPSGLNGKYFVSESTALDFGIGWIYSPYYYGDGFHLYGDFLWHPVSLVSAPAFELPFYVGVGLRYWDFSYCDRGVCNFGGSTVGIRVPVGISFDFNNVPLDIFIQLVPVLDFVNGDYYDRFRDRTHFGVDLSAGIRYWFK